MAEEKKYDQNEYNKTWIEKNKAQYLHTKYKNNAKGFIRNKATIEELKDIIELANSKLIERQNEKAVEADNV